MSDITQPFLPPIRGRRGFYGFTRCSALMGQEATRTKRGRMTATPSFLTLCREGTAFLVLVGTCFRFASPRTADGLTSFKISEQRTQKEGTEKGVVPHPQNGRKWANTHVYRHDRPSIQPPLLTGLPLIVGASPNVWHHIGASHTRNGTAPRLSIRTNRHVFGSTGQPQRHQRSRPNRPTADRGT